MICCWVVFVDKSKKYHMDDGELCDLHAKITLLKQEDQNIKQWRSQFSASLTVRLCPEEEWERLLS